MKARDRFRRPFGLTDRECDVLEQIAEGGSAPEIAARMHLAVATVHAHKNAIYFKMDVHTSAAAVAVGFRSGLLE